MFVKIMKFKIYNIRLYSQLLKKLYKKHPVQEKVIYNYFLENYIISMFCCLTKD
jgi:hypothetical protein